MLAYVNPQGHTNFVDTTFLQLIRLQPRPQYGQRQTPSKFKDPTFSRPRPNRFPTSLSPWLFHHSEGAQRDEAQHKDHEQGPTNDQHGRVLVRSTNDTWELGRSNHLPRLPPPKDLHPQGKSNIIESAKPGHLDTSECFANHWGADSTSSVPRTSLTWYLGRTTPTTLVFETGYIT